MFLGVFFVVLGVFCGFLFISLAISPGRNVSGQCVWFSLGTCTSFYLTNNLILLNK